MLGITATPYTLARVLTAGSGPIPNSGLGHLNALSANGALFVPTVCNILTTGSAYRCVAFLTVILKAP